MTPVNIINSLGGPYVVLPEAALALYPGAKDPKLYETVSMTREADSGVLTRVLGFDAIVLGTPDPLAVFVDPSGVILARMRYFESDDQDIFEEHMGGIPEDVWEPLAGGNLEVTGTWYVFDCAAEGASAKTWGLALPLTDGTYEVSSCDYQPDDDAGYDLVRLRRVD